MPQQHEIVYETTGLTIKKNASNKFCVVTLHHTADPAKRSEAWRREAANGMTPEKFAREYDIDYTSVMGSKVFPELTAKKPTIVVSEPWPDFGPHQRYWGGLDYGARNPSSFHVYTHSDGIWYSVWELFKPCKNVGDYVKEMKLFPYWQQIRWIAADPKMWANDQQQSDGLTSMADLFAEQGVLNLIKGFQDEDPWIAQVRKYWTEEDPGFKILSCCTNQIREFETAIYVNQSERQLMSASYKEQIADRDNHSLDDCKYFMLSKPNVNQAQYSGGDVRMVDRHGQNSKAPTPQGMPRHSLRGYY